MKDMGGAVELEGANSKEHAKHSFLMGSGAHGHKCVTVETEKEESPSPTRAGFGS